MAEQGCCQGPVMQAPQWQTSILQLPLRVVLKRKEMYYVMGGNEYSDTETVVLFIQMSILMGPIQWEENCFQYWFEIEIEIPM